jgi:hypothetical protein
LISVTTPSNTAHYYRYLQLQLYPSLLLQLDVKATARRHPRSTHVDSNACMLIAVAILLPQSLPSSSSSRAAHHGYKQPCRNQPLQSRVCTSTLPPAVR